MITLTAKINLLSGDNKALSLGSDNLSGNNISSNLSGIVGVKKNGRNPFIIGASKLGDGSTFSDGVDYFIGDKLSDEEKANINSGVEALKEALKGEDIEAIKSKQEELQKTVYAVSEKIYKASAEAQGAAGAEGAPQGDPNVYEADFKDADDNK